MTLWQNLDMSERIAAAQTVSGIRSPDRNGVGAVVSCKRIPLGGSDADVPVNGMVNSILG